MDEAGLLAVASGVEADSEHPLARAIVDGAEQRGVEAKDATEFAALPGLGASATIQGETVHVGGPRLLADLGVKPEAAVAQSAEAWASRGAHRPLRRAK